MRKSAIWFTTSFYEKGMENRTLRGLQAWFKTGSEQNIMT
jgi:hypothetical protein